MTFQTKCSNENDLAQQSYFVIIKNNTDHFHDDVNSHLPCFASAVVYICTCVARLGRTSGVLGTAAKGSVAFCRFRLFGSLFAGGALQARCQEV